MLRLQRPGNETAISAHRKRDPYRTRIDDEVRDTGSVCFSYLGMEQLLVETSHHITYRLKMVVAALATIVFVVWLLVYSSQGRTGQLARQAGESRRRLPQAILIGARKGGTRALIEMLESHPDVVRAQREIHYFDRDENYSKGLQWYLHRMPFSTPGQITMEKTPAYFVTQGVPRRLYLYPKDVKILLTVRDPVIRAISDFAHIDAHRVIDHQPRNTFEEEVLRPNGELNTNRSPISNSTYDVHMKRWLEYFSLEQIHIVNGDSLIQDPFSELQKVERFLEISSFFQKDMFFFDEKKGFFCWNRLNEKAGEVKCCLGQAKGRKHPDVSEHTIIKLREFFRPHNERFYKLVHQNFGW